MERLNMACPMSLGQGLVPMVNKLQDIFASVRA